MSELFNKEQQQVFKEIKAETGINVEIIAVACVSQFQFVAKEMETNYLTKADKPILLNFLGKFKVKKGRRKALNEAEARNKNAE